MNSISKPTFSSSAGAASLTPGAAQYMFNSLVATRSGEFDTNDMDWACVEAWAHNPRTLNIPLALRAGLGSMSGKR
jgi:hypothetical protein